MSKAPPAITPQSRGARQPRNQPRASPPGKTDNCRAVTQSHGSWVSRTSTDAMRRRAAGDGPGCSMLTGPSSLPPSVDNGAMNRRSFLSLAVALPIAQARSGGAGRRRRDRVRQGPRTRGQRRPHLQRPALRRVNRRRAAIPAGREAEAVDRDRDAVAYGPRAPQPFRPMIPEIGDALIGQGPMSEDCLLLNVWTPARGAAARGRSWCGCTAADIPDRLRQRHLLRRRTSSPASTTSSS